MYMVDPTNRLNNNTNLKRIACQNMWQFMEEGEWLIRGANGWKGKLTSHKKLAPSAWNSTLKWNDSYFAGAEWLKL